MSWMSWDNAGNRQRSPYSLDLPGSCETGLQAIAEVGCSFLPASEGQSLGPLEQHSKPKFPSNMLRVKAR